MTLLLEFYSRIGLVVLLLSACSPAVAQQSLATLRGHVADEFGGSIVGATVTIADESGVEKTTSTETEGNYVFPGLAPGRYSLRVSAEGFALYEVPAVEVTAGRHVPLNITLSVAIEEVEVTITADSPISTEPDSSAGALVLRDSDLQALPDDPDDLADALQALAGPSAGLGGGEMFIDGFTGGRLPPKESIREVRLNRNPFSAEYDRLGYGRIEIFTKPGTDKFRGQTFFNFNDSRLNSRNPFSATRAPFQSRRYGGNVSGPLSAQKASLFIDMERREVDDFSVVRAVVLDPSLNIVPFIEEISSPNRRTTFSPRLDYQINATNTVIASYSYTRFQTLNSGVGDFNLPSRAYDTTYSEHTIRFTETAVISQKVINETRFQYELEQRKQEGVSQEPAIRVSEAFTGGGSPISFSRNREHQYELQNYTSWTMGNHSLKAGVRLRVTRITDNSPQNYNGTFTFSGGIAPQLDANNQIVLGPDGLPIASAITSIERYRRTQLFLQQRLSPAEIRLRGGGATQFSISGGNPEVNVSQVDFGPFIQNDWRLRPNLTLSLGMRYEVQNNIRDWTNFAPRFAFAWSPGAGADTRQQTTVIRGGFGLFYQRFSENLTLQANRSSLTNEQQFVITSASANGITLLDLFPTVPSIDTLTAFNIPRTTRRVAEDLRAPYTMQGSISLERQLPHNLTLSISYITARTNRVFRSRNINAPLPETVIPGVSPGVRPFGNIGNIFQYESTGRFNQNQLIINLSNRLSRNIRLFGNYVLNKANSDTDGPNTFPANQYDLTGEHGRAASDIRHRVFIGGSLNVLPWRISLSPFIIANSGRPFNITTGRDTNADTLFRERPAFAADLTKPGIITTRFGVFDPNPTPDQLIIPRNYGEGPGFFTVNMRLSRSFGFGPETASADGAGSAGGPGAGQGGRGGRGRMGGGQGGRRGGTFGDGGTSNRRYNLNFSVNVQNLLNRTNLGSPVGNLTSPLFGQSINSIRGFGFRGGGSESGNRRIELQVRLSF